MTKFQYEDNGGLTFLSKDERAILIKEAAEFTVTSASLRPGGGYKGADGWVLKVNVDDEERLLGFTVSATGNSRDSLCAALVRHFELEDAEPAGPFVLRKVGENGFVAILAADAE